MKVGILGSGKVATALASGFLDRGDEVMLGTRSPEKLADFLAESGEVASAGSFADAASFGEVGVIATAGTGTESAIEIAGAERFASKVVIDVTNPLVVGEDGPPGLEVGHTDSRGEQIQRWLPEARVVKALNIVNNQQMVGPEIPGGPPDMLICGDDDGAKRIVTGILSDFGWPVIDMGGIEASRELEPLCILWVRYALAHDTTDHAFKLLHS